MSNLLSSLLNNAKKPELGFGIHKNCKITAVNNIPRTNKNGETMSGTNFTTFTQYDETGMAVAEKEVQWFKHDPSSEYSDSQLFSTLEQLTTILYLHCTEEEVETNFDNLFKKYGVENKAGLDELSNTEKSLEFYDDMSKIYVGLLSAKLNSVPVKLKLVYTSNFKYIQLPRYGSFIEAQSVPDSESILSFSQNELADQSKASSAAVPSSITSV
jgi:hypothetical protein